MTPNQATATELEAPAALALLWQAGRKGPAQTHAYRAGEAQSVCGAQTFLPEALGASRPAAKRICRLCLASLLEADRETVLELPLEAFGWVLTSRGIHVIQSLAPKARTMRDLALLTEDALRAQRNCGAKSVEAIKTALSMVGLTLGGQALAKGRRRVDRPHEGLGGGTAHDEQALRFLQVIGEDGIRTWSYQAMGDLLGISRERVRQIFRDNTFLQALRGDGPQACLEGRAKVTLEAMRNGVPIQVASRLTGVGEAYLNRRAKADSNLAEALAVARREGKKARAEDKRKVDEHRVRQVVSYAKANKVSMRGACKALGYSYNSLIKAKDQRVTHMKDDPEMRAVLDPRNRTLGSRP